MLGPLLSCLLFAVGRLELLCAVTQTYQPSQALCISLCTVVELLPLARTGTRTALCSPWGSLRLLQGPTHHSVHHEASATHRDRNPDCLVQAQVSLQLLPGLVQGSVHSRASASCRDGDPRCLVQLWGPVSSFQAPCTALCTMGLLPLTGMRTHATLCGHRVPSASSRPCALHCASTSQVLAAARWGGSGGWYQPLAASHLADISSGHFLGNSSSPLVSSTSLFYSPLHHPLLKLLCTQIEN